MTGAKLLRTATERSFVSNPIKRRRPRRTKAIITDIKTKIYEFIEEFRPVTVRQCFYQMTVAGVVDKHETDYQRTIIRLLVEMREAGDLPFDWISDNTRWMRKPVTFSGVDHCLRNTATAYRRALWESLPAYVEIWLEKEALAGVVVDITSEYDVPLMVSKGYASISFLHSAAETITGVDKRAFIYQFGDHDPSGVDLARDIEVKLRRYAPEAEIHFERVAVTPAQIQEWDLPTRPTKQKDTRARKFTGESVELDAIPPDRLRDLVRRSIARHVDQRQLALLRLAEDSERQLIAKWAEVVSGGRRP